MDWNVSAATCAKCAKGKAYATIFHFKHLLVLLMVSAGKRPLQKPKGKRQSKSNSRTEESKSKSSLSCCAKKNAKKPIRPRPAALRPRPMISGPKPLPPPSSNLRGNKKLNSSKSSMSEKSDHSGSQMSDSQRHQDKNRKGSREKPQRSSDPMSMSNKSERELKKPRPGTRVLTAEYTVGETLSPLQPPENQPPKQSEPEKKKEKKMKPSAEIFKLSKERKKSADEVALALFTAEVINDKGQSGKQRAQKPDEDQPSYSLDVHSYVKNGQAIHEWVYDESIPKHMLHLFPATTKDQRMNDMADIKTWRKEMKNAARKEANKSPKTPAFPPMIRESPQKVYLENQSVTMSLSSFVETEEENMPSQFPCVYKDQPKCSKKAKRPRELTVQNHLRGLQCRP